jgi:endoglucanase
MIHAQGIDLVDGAGKPRRLRGVNLGGWLLWEGWIWGGGFRSETDLMARFAEVVGAEEANAFRRQVWDRFVTDDDFAKIAEAGFDSVRIPFNFRLLEDSSGADRAEGWAVLDRAIASARAHGLVVLLDLHAAPGGQSRYFMADPEGVPLWDDAAARARTVALWARIAGRYSRETAVAGYDLLNEPIPRTGDDLATLDRDIVAAIRRVDPDHLVIVEGANFAHDFRMFGCPLDANQAYSFHLYTWFGEDVRAPLAMWSRLPLTQAVPLWCGEFGENDAPKIARTVAAFGDPSFAIHGGWAFWTWKKVVNHYPALMEISPPPAWTELMAYVQQPRNTPRPTPVRAKEGMAEFLDASSASMLVENPSIRKALLQ